MSGDIEKENIVLQRFVWKDDKHKCEAGQLLYALTELTIKEDHTTSCTDENVEAYLTNKGLVQKVDAGLKLVDGKYQEAEDLGNRISEHVGSEIEAIPSNKKIQLAPSIFMMAVPLPCTQSNETAEESEKE